MQENYDEGSFSLRKGKSLDYSLDRLVKARHFNLNLEGEKSDYLIKELDFQIGIFLLTKNFRSKNRSSKRIFFNSYEHLSEKFSEYCLDRLPTEGELISDSKIKSSLTRLEKIKVIDFEFARRVYSGGRRGAEGLAITIKIISRKQDLFDIAYT